MKVRLLLPQPIFQAQRKKGTSIVIRRKERVVNGELMFMRFVSSEVDEHSHVSAGLFCAAFRLFDEMVLMGWFRVNLRGPFIPTCRSSWLGLSLRKNRLSQSLER